MTWTDPHGNDHFICGGIHYVVRSAAWQSPQKWTPEERKSADQFLMFGSLIVLALAMIDLSIIYIAFRIAS